LEDNILYMNGSRFCLWRQFGQFCVESGRSQKVNYWGSECAKQKNEEENCRPDFDSSADTKVESPSKENEEPDSVATGEQ